MSQLTKLESMESSSAKKLKEQGIDDIEAVAVTSAGEICNILDINSGTASQIISEARDKTLGDMGFQTGSEVEPSADFSDVDAPEEVYGWNRFIKNQSRIGWASPAGYRIIIEGHQCRIWGNLPNEDQEQPNEITKEQTLRPRMESPEEAVEWVKNWMVMRTITPDSNLSEHYGIGDKLAEHLQIVYAVNDGADLYQFLLEDEKMVEKIVGSQNFDQLKKELQQQFGSMNNTVSGGEQQ